jgi:SAM-dependent methyltransferase
LLPAGFQPAWIMAEREKTREKNWDFIILDRFQTPEEEFLYWAGLAPLVGLDEGGPFRNYFDFLIDLLPGLPGRSGANLCDPSLLPLPHVRRPFAESGGGKLLRALVSFGQEDSAGLGSAVARILAAENSDGLEISLLGGILSGARAAGKEPPARTRNNGLAGVRLLAPFPDLRDHLAEYDLLITHFGQSAFEALSAGTPVLLVSPTPYHEKLAKNAGFFSAGPGKRGLAKLGKLLFLKKPGKPAAINRNFLRALTNRCAALSARCGLDGEPEQSLASLISGFSPSGARECPACGKTAAGLPEFSRIPFPAPLARFAGRSYYRCPRCGLVYLRRLNPPPFEYGREYFFDLYKKQYGKTYVEDFPGLVAAGKRRLRVIGPLLAGGTARAPGCPAETGKEPPASGGVSRNGTRRLLDIGCAYGPFLAAAREEGFVPVGVDPSEDAGSYVRGELSIEARQGFFPDAPPPDFLEEKSFDAVTLWYVIEHFENCVPVFERIRRVLKTGGVLAFSTPSFSGVSGRKSLTRFLERSPPDHITIWSPRASGALLKKAGFTVRKIVITGHHPERFPLIGRLAREKTAPLYGPLSALSRLFALGDTFEVYAVHDGGAGAETALAGEKT